VSSAAVLGISILYKNIGQPSADSRVTIAPTGTSACCGYLAHIDKHPDGLVGAELPQLLSVIGPATLDYAT
jgi:hypothetical protein